MLSCDLSGWLSMGNHYSTFRNPDLAGSRSVSSRDRPGINLLRSNVVQHLAVSTFHPAEGSAS